MPLTTPGSGSASEPPHVPAARLPDPRGHPVQLPGHLLHESTFPARQPGPKGSTWTTEAPHSRPEAPTAGPASPAGGQTLTSGPVRRCQALTSQSARPPGRPEGTPPGPPAPGADQPISGKRGRECPAHDPPEGADRTPRRRVRGAEPGRGTPLPRSRSVTQLRVNERPGDAHGRRAGRCRPAPDWWGCGTPWEPVWRGPGARPSMRGEPPRVVEGPGSTTLQQDPWLTWAPRPARLVKVLRPEPMEET
jgi:hypothetical protein